MARFIERHADAECAGSPLRDWIEWESGLEPAAPLLMLLDCLSSVLVWGLTGVVAHKLCRPPTISGTLLAKLHLTHTRIK